ncbi:MAG: fimbrillin family protein [Bacteroides sp]|nr:fimbrillin family protein [Bacteroides sp.]
MKKMFIFAALTSVALASCTTDVSVFEPVDTSNQINFVAANYVTQTRAEHYDLAFSNADYTVWAWENGSDVAYMNKVKVTAPSTVNGTYYWPNYALDFAATTPDNDPRIALTRSGGKSTITFTFDATNANTTTTNLMYADFVESQSYDSDSGTGTSTVALKFRHVLAKLNVTVHQANPNPLPAGITGYSVTVNSLSFNGLLCEGSLEVEEGEYDGATTNYLWTPSTTVTADWDIINSAQSIASDFTKGNYFVMPQAIPADATLNIDYTVTTTFQNGTTSTKKFSKIVDLKEIEDSSSNAITEWKTNKNVTYTINIAPAALQLIAFTVNEEEMGNIGGSYTF